jgi:tricorn protease-like protein
VTIFNVNKDENKIIMYNDYGDDKNIYLYDIEKDKLEKTDNKKFTFDDNTPKYCELEKYEDPYMIAGSNCVQIDDRNICFLIYPKELDGKEGTSGMQIVILNKDTNKEERYNVFS